MFLPLPLLMGTLVGVVVGLVSGSLLAACIAFLVISAGVAVGLYYAADAIALRLLHARPLAHGGSLELRNSLEELCARTGSNEPALYTAGPGQPAIASLGRRSPSLVVTDGLSDELTVVELEAAFARELARAQSGSTTVDTLAVPFVTLPLAPFGSSSARVLQWLRGGDYDAVCDLDGIGITRYPPGLSAALRKMSVDGIAAPARSSAVAHLWAVGGNRHQKRAGHYGVEERLELLAEL